jgi:DNA-binding beta-propeller fold protein YncE
VPASKPRRTLAATAIVSRGLHLVWRKATCRKLEFPRGKFAVKEVSSLIEFGWTRTLFSIIILVAAIPGVADLSSAQTINPAQQQISLPGSPFGAVTTQDGRYVFVSLVGTTSGAVAVIRQKKRFATVVQMIPTCGTAHGMVMSKGGRFLLVAVQGDAPCGGVQFIDVPKAIAGDPNAAMGTVPTDKSAIELAITPDNSLVFVANEFSGGEHCEKQDSVSVIDFKKALSSGQSESSVIGAIPVDCAPVGLAVSADGRDLYVTNEGAFKTRPFFDQTACSIPDGPACPITMHEGAVGTLDVVDVSTARTNPAGSVVAFIPAGCSPTRVILTNNDQIAWVSARDLNELLAFNAGQVLDNPSTLPVSTAPVGTAPDGVQPFFRRRFFAVANTNRFDSCPGAVGTVTILKVNKVLFTSTVGTFDAGVFPRQWALSPDGRLLYLTEFGSDTLAIFPVRSIVNQVQ